jgi:hypothetical protein
LTRPLNEDTVFDKVVRFVFGAIVGTVFAVIFAGIHSIVHTHTLDGYLGLLAIGAVLGGVAAVRKK